uniref:Uncharacterized protein n=1 Tax=Steinernema glaseri TaxID=37863 RepID=A0A1I7YPW4_9BILA
MLNQGKKKDSRNMDDTEHQLTVTEPLTPNSSKKAPKRLQFYLIASRRSLISRHYYFDKERRAHFGHNKAVEGGSLAENKGISIWRRTQEDKGQIPGRVQQEMKFDAKGQPEPSEALFGKLDLLEPSSIFKLHSIESGKQADPDHLYRKLPFYAGRSSASSDGTDKTEKCLPVQREMKFDANGQPEPSEALFGKLDLFEPWRIFKLHSIKGGKQALPDRLYIRLRFRICILNHLKR